MRGPFRSALGLAFILMSVFLLAPVSKPNLWVLEDWGDFRWPVWIWPLIFMLVGVSLFRAKEPHAVRWALFAAFLLLGIVAVASYLSQGWNSYTVFVIPFAYYCGQLNLDIKAEARRDL